MKGKVDLVIILSYILALTHIAETSKPDDQMLVGGWASSNIARHLNHFWMWERQAGRYYCGIQVESFLMTNAPNNVLAKENPKA